MSRVIVNALVLLEDPPSHPGKWVVCTQENYVDGTFARLDPPLGEGDTRAAALAGAAVDIGTKEWYEPLASDTAAVKGYWV